MLAFMGAVSACVNDDYVVDDVIKTKTSKEGLTISPAVSESSVVVSTTRAESVEALKEKEMNTLDVFVEHITDGTPDGTIMKAYHLPLVENQPYANQAQHFLANSWRKEGLKEREYYRIYVTANSSSKTGTIVANTSVADLLALSYDEVSAGIATLTEDKTNIASRSGNVYKQYASTSSDLNALTNEKQFMMDGVIKEWTPETTSQSQEFDVTMNRAAAKIVLNVNFDTDFLASLEEEGVEVKGTPAWKFNNFAFGAPVFDPKTFDEDAAITPIEVHNSQENIIHHTEYAGDDKNFQIITYTYPNAWAQADYATKAPSLVVSVRYYDKVETDKFSTHYYRVPLVKSDVTSINRNTIYVINATIATRGSDTHEDITEMDNLVYEVLPWNDQNNSDVIHNKVEAVQHLYLKVNPVIYTLRGDGDQTLIINYMKATGTEVGWKLFAIDPTTEAKGNPVDDPESGVWGWFYDKNGKMKTTFSDWTHMGVEIEQSTEGKNNSSGTVTVTSTALHNRAIKYMLLRVYLKDSPTLYEDVLIRHFPTDNIQNIPGHWSSYHTAGSGTVREYSWDPPADGWEAGTYQSETVDVEVEATPAEYLAGKASRTNYSGRVDMNGYDVDWWSGYTYYRDFWTNAVPQESRQGANSEANAYGPDDSGNYWWGEGSQNSNQYRYDYDWTTQTGNRLTYYRYSYFYYSKYTKTEQRTRYYRDVEAPVGTGNWVDWDRDAGKTGIRKYDNRGDDPDCENTLFHAHIFSGGVVHNLNSTYYDNAAIGEVASSTQTNNHMYVIQISSTSDKYVLGKPLVRNNVSQDQVVAPAFMIASQLGIVTVKQGWGVGDDVWNSERAADHCSKYMEVADDEDKTRYTGWRLPTADEIRVIVNYQQGKFGDITISPEDRVIAEVLQGARYYNLSGGETPTNIDGASNAAFLRCIRELSAEEIDKLNGFDTLINKYQKKPNGN